nr:hypothetical protein [Tanacetum cinerariifolium]
MKASVSAGSRNSSASVSAGRSILAASRNKPASIHAGKHILAGRINKQAPFPAGDPTREVPVNETFHVQTNDELTKKELKQIEANDQAILTILLGLPEDIYAAVDSYETTQEIWLRV